MKLRSILLVALCLVLTAVTTLAEEPVHLTFAVMEQGTGPYACAEAIRDAMLKALPEGSEIELVEASNGAVDAPEQLENSDYDLIMSNAGPAAWYAEAHEDTAVRALIGGIGYDFVNVMMTASYAYDHNISTLEEIVSQKLPVRLYVKNEGSLGEITAQYVLEALGVTYADIESWGGTVVHTDSNSIRQAFLDGEADLTIDHITAWQANTTEICEQVSMVFPQLETSTLWKLKDHGYSLLSVESGMFKGAGAIATAGFEQVVLVKESMPEDVAYMLVKGVCENAEAMAEAVPALGNFDPMDAGHEDLCGMELHAGAIRYFWENGYTAKEQ